MSAEALEVVLDDRLGVGGRALGELGAHDVDAGLVEDALGAGPAELEHVDARQDAQRQHVAALGEVVDDEVGGRGAEGVAADGL
jgi:hypothetical protein